MFEYTERIIRQIKRIEDSQADKIKEAAAWCARTIVDDKIIHTFGTGHSQMIAMEPFTRAGGLANVNAILDSTALTFEGARRSASIEQLSGIAQIVWDQHKIDDDDLLIVISNSGRNAMPIEMATIAKDRGIQVIAITSIAQSFKYPSRHKSGLRLFDMADLVIDNLVPPGDGLMNINHNLTGPPSSIAGIYIIQTIVTEAMKLAAAQGVKLPVYFSQNIDGYSNEALYHRFEKRIKHL